MEERVAFTVTFPTAGPLPDAEALALWLTEQGEPFEREGHDILELRALPVRLVLDSPAIHAHVDLTPQVSLTRLVRVLFDLSVRLGADVRLVGAGEVTRSRLWLRFADAQDRLRLAAALAKAGSHNRREEVIRQLWSLLGIIGDGHDLRWDAARGEVVRLVEVGVEISVDEAAWHKADAAVGDTVAIPVDSDVHIIAWRWLSEAWPRLVES